MAFEDEIAKLGGTIVTPPLEEPTAKAITGLGGTITKVGAPQKESVDSFEQGQNAAVGNEFSRGVARASARGAASMLDFARVFSDSPKLKQIADEFNATAEAIPTKAASVSDVLSNPALAPAYVGRVVGELAPQAVAAYLTGGLGKIAGSAAKLGTTGLRVATGAGAALTSVPQEVGGMFRETEDLTGTGNKAAALGFGIPSGLLDAISAERIVGKIFRIPEKEGRKMAWRQIVRDTVKEIPKTAGVEATTETMQEGLALLADKAADETFELLTPDNGKRLLESAVAGAIGGGLLGGGMELAQLPAQGKARSEEYGRLRELRQERDSLRSRYRGSTTQGNVLETPIEVTDPNAKVGQEFEQNGIKYRVNSVTESTSNGETRRKVTALPIIQDATLMVSPVQPKTEPFIDVQEVKPTPPVTATTPPPSPVSPEANTEYDVWKQQRDANGQDSSRVLFESQRVANAQKGQESQNVTGIRSSEERGDGSTLRGISSPSRSTQQIQAPTSASIYGTQQGGATDGGVSGSASGSTLPEARVGASGEGKVDEGMGGNDRAGRPRGSDAAGDGAQVGTSSAPIRITVWKAQRQVGDIKEGPKLGEFYTDNEQTANSLADLKGDVTKHEVTLEKPLVIPSKPDGFEYYDSSELNAIMKAAGVKFKFSDILDGDEVWRHIDDGGKKLINALKKAGYDSVQFPEFLGGKNQTTTLVFDKKPATPLSVNGGEKPVETKEKEGQVLAPVAGVTSVAPAATSSAKLVPVLTSPTGEVISSGTSHADALIRAPKDKAMEAFEAMQEDSQHRFLDVSTGKVLTREEAGKVSGIGGSLQSEQLNKADTEKYLAELQKQPIQGAPNANQVQSPVEVSGNQSPGPASQVAARAPGSVQQTSGTSPEAQTQEVTPALTPIETLSKAKSVKIKAPEGATQLRVITQDGKSTVQPLASVNKGQNIFQGVAIARLESGTIEKSGKFKKIAGEISVVDTAKKGIQTSINENTNQDDSLSGKNSASMDEKAVEDRLKRSGKVLWGTGDSVAQALVDAITSRLGKRSSGGYGGLRGLYSGSQKKSNPTVQKPGIIISENPEALAGKPNAQIFADRILQGRWSNEGPEVQLLGRSAFIQLLGRKLQIPIIFRVVTEDKNAGLMRYDRMKGVGDFISVNMLKLSGYDLSKPENQEMFDAAFTEELLHAATFRSSSSSEIEAVWNSLSKDEQKRMRVIYGGFNTTEEGGAEYIRVVLQDILARPVTEETDPNWAEKRGLIGKLSEASKTVLRNLINFIRNQFGNKPENNIARQVVGRIEAAIRGEAQIGGSSFFDNTEGTSTSIDRSIDPEDDRAHEPITTQIFGVIDTISGRASYTEDQKSLSRSIAKAAYDEAGIQVTTPSDDPGGSWQIAKGEQSDAAGRKLVETLKREIDKYGSGAMETANLVNSIVLNFKNGRMEFSKAIRNDLYAVAQGDRSKRGVALAALRGAGDSIRFVSQNIDVVLQTMWHERYGGKEIDSVIDKFRQRFRAFFTPEVVSEIVKVNPELVKHKGSAEIIQKGLDTDFANLTELRDIYLQALVKDGFDPKQAALLARQIVETLKPRIRTAGENAAKDIDSAMTPNERQTVKGKKPIWQQMVEMAQRGEFDNGPLLREKAAKNGWRPPSDAEITRIKRLAERERELASLTKREVEDAKGDKTKLAKEQAVREEATLPQRLPLMRQMEAAWGAITRPVNLRPWNFFGSNKANNAAFVNELVSADLLLRISFPFKQALSVLSQFALHVPTRAMAQAIELHSQSKTLEQPTAIHTDIYNALAGSFKAAIVGYKDGVNQFVAALRGRGEARNVDRLMSGIAAIERIDAQAKQYAEQGKTGMAILYRLFGWVRLGYRVAQAFDNLHGVPSEYVEMRHQVVLELMKNGVGRTEANSQADNVIQSVKASLIDATAQAKAFLNENKMEYTSETIREISHRIARRWAYETIRSQGLPADDFQQANKDLREVIGWNEQEADFRKGIGGVVGASVTAIGKVAERTFGLPLPIGRFGNAIAIGINRALHLTPLGFFPEAFGGESNAWFKTELDRNQRKVEASVGSLLGSIAFMAVLSGVFTVRLKWPKDPKERDAAEARGERPGTIMINNPDGTFTAVSLSVGPLAVLAPYFAAGGALRDLLDTREKAQEKLNAEALKKGVPAEKIRPMSAFDMVGVAYSAGMQTILGGRTAGGIVGSMTDFGNLNVTKLVAGQTAGLIPLLPGLQEVSRMSGVVLDSKLATFTDFLLPLPSSPARKVNFLGDPSGTPDDMQRIVQTLTGGSYPNIDPTEQRTSNAYGVLFNSGYRPPSIDPNKGRLIDGAYRPLSDSELERYTVARGEEFKKALASVPLNADEKTVRSVFRQADRRALQKIGVTVAAPRVSSGKVRRSGLRGRVSGLRSMRATRRKGLRSLRFKPATFRSLRA